MEIKKYFYYVKFSHAELCGTPWDSGRFVTRNSAKKSGQTDLASRERKARTGQPYEDRRKQDIQNYEKSQNRTATSGQIVQDYHNMTGRTGLTERDRQTRHFRTRTGQPV
jgi:hypothetical protein